jgi:hypothetical protein
MTRCNSRLVLLVTIAALVTMGCDTPSPTSVKDQGAGDPVSVKTANPEFDPDNFVSGITNRHLMLTPGTTFHYRSETPDGLELNDVSVTRDIKQILGVDATVVHDQVFVDGELTEDTFDWYAQDRDGNVWYLGEDTKELENGEVVSTEGSWEAGVGDNRPGIIMLAHPKTGLFYHQEIAPDVAEDVARVLSLKAKVDVPYGTFDGCLRTLESSLVELGVHEHKFYCPGVGLALEVHPKEHHTRVELTDISHF